MYCKTLIRNPTLINCIHSLCWVYFIHTSFGAGEKIRIVLIKLVFTLIFIDKDSVSISSIFPRRWSSFYIWDDWASLFSTLIKDVVENKPIPTLLLLCFCRNDVIGYRVNRQQNIILLFEKQWTLRFTNCEWNTHVQPFKRTIIV